ncbi:MAG: hypothetical protein HYV20_07255 [Gemmatimonadetes bacterium]|nr:hypothetical protein [Gemmatimonadota bacterium]
MKRLLSAGLLCALMLTLAPPLDAAAKKRPPKKGKNPVCTILQGLADKDIVPDMVVTIVCGDKEEE